MRIQVLVAAVDQDMDELIDRMKLSTEAIIINQCGRFAYEERERGGNKIRCYSFAERGVGLCRNNALMRADGDVCVFSDEDIVYADDYAEKIRREYDRHPEADLILFNVDVAPSRATYRNEGVGRVRWYNYGRYPAYSVTARTEALRKANVSFSLLFGGGARYSNGEDSLFLRDCLRKRLRIVAVPAVIGAETERESTWFNGYHEKFFRDRGVLYHFLYGVMAKPFSLRFLLAHRGTMCGEIPLGKAYRLMAEGIAEAKSRRGVREV